jgi:hypothetical protein
MMLSNQENRTVGHAALKIPLATAGGVLVVLVVQRIVGGIISLIGALASGTVDSVWQFVVIQSVWLDVVFAVGVFLALRFLSPITAGLPLLTVILRSFLTVVAGAVLVFIAVLLAGVVNALGGLLGTQTGFQPDVALRALGSGIWAGGGYVVSASPVVILAGVLLWIWLARHPRNTPVPELRAQV